MSDRSDRTDLGTVGWTIGPEGGSPEHHDANGIQDKDL